MSLGRRLLNVAKAELQDAARKVRHSAEHLLDPLAPASHEAAERDTIRDEVRREQAHGSPEARRHDVSPEIARFYANLELPVGADAPQVKAAYRRLMRRYHPDKHAQHPDRAKVAGEVSQKLRAAYEGLMAHLERG